MLSLVQTHCLTQRDERRRADLWAHRPEQRKPPDGPGDDRVKNPVELGTPNHSAACLPMQSVCV